MCFGSVGEEWGDGDDIGIIEDFVDAWVGSSVWLIAEAVWFMRKFCGIPAASMWVACGVVKKEGFFGVARDDCLTVVGHFYDTSAIAGYFGLEKINLFGAVVMLARSGGSVAGFLE